MSIGEGYLDERLETFADAIQLAAHHTAPLVRRLGWDLDDCRQEARLGIITMSVEGLASLTHALAYVVARRAIIKAGRRKNNPPGLAVDPSFLETVEARGEYGMTAELADLIDKAPHAVRLYVGYRVFDGLTWAETAAEWGKSNTQLARVRTEAADWLLTQLEGRK